MANEFGQYLQYLQGQDQYARDPLQVQGGINQMNQAMQSNQAVMAQRNAQQAALGNQLQLANMQQQGQNARLDTVAPLLAQLMGGSSGGGFGGFTTNYGASVKPGGGNDYNSIVQQNAQNQSLYGGGAANSSGSYSAAPTIQPVGQAQPSSPYAVDNTTSPNGLDPGQTGKFIPGRTAQPTAQQSFKPTYADGSTDYTQMTPYRNPNGNYGSPGGGYGAKPIDGGTNPMADPGYRRRMAMQVQGGRGPNLTTSRYSASTKV